MDRQAVIDELRNIVGGYLKNLGLELVDLIYRYEGRDLILRVLADRSEGGISLGECANLNHEIGRILDEQGILQARYILEVSSPGLDRPLKSKSDFLRCIDRRARFFLSEPANGKMEWEGFISGIRDDGVEVKTKEGSILIPFAKINKAKQVIGDI